MRRSLDLAEEIVRVFVQQDPVGADLRDVVCVEAPRGLPIGQDESPALGPSDRIDHAAELVFLGDQAEFGFEEVHTVVLPPAPERFEAVEPLLELLIGQVAVLPIIDRNVLYRPFDQIMGIRPNVRRSNRHLAMVPACPAPTLRAPLLIRTRIVLTEADLVRPPDQRPGVLEAPGDGRCCGHAISRGVEVGLACSGHHSAPPISSPCNHANFSSTG
jgi:hypothetical protein